MDTWNDVKDATNRCLNSIGNLKNIDDPVHELYGNCLPEALNTVAIYHFTHGIVGLKIDDITMIRRVLIQLNKHGYIRAQHERI